MMLVVFWCGLTVPSFAHAETKDSNLFCSVLGWVVKPIGFCKEEIIPEISPNTENSVTNPVVQGPTVPTPFSSTDEILEVRPIELGNTLESDSVPVTIVKEYVTVNGSGVSEAYVDQRIRELLIYINSFPRTTDLLAMDRNPSELVDASDYVTREYIYKTLDKVDNQIDNAIDSLKDSLTSEPIFTSPTLVDAILNGTTYVNGRLGLGTSSPADLLAVEGAVYLAETNPTQVDDRLYNFGGDLYWNGSVVTSAALGNWSASGSDVFRLAGNVGIGTTSPYAKLSVVGNVVADSYMALSTTSTSTFMAGVDLGAGNGYFIGGYNVLSGSIAGGVVGFDNTNSSGGVAIGMSNNSTGFSGTAIGMSNITSSTIATAIGFGNDASNFFATAIGYSNIASAFGSVAIGSGVENSIADSLMLGPSDAAKLTILSSGNVGIGTTTPDSELTVAGDLYLTGAFKDSTNAAGTLGQILSSTGAATVWTSTSSLGLGNGTFLGLSDTPSSYTANRLIFTNSGGTALTDSANLVFDGTNFGIGSSTPGNRFSVGGNSYLVGGGSSSDVALTVKSGYGFDSANLQDWRKYDGTLVASVLGTGGLAVNRSSTGGYSHFGPDTTNLTVSDAIDSLVVVKNDTLGVGTYRALTAAVEFSAPIDSAGSHFGLNGFAYLQSNNNLTSSLATGAGGLSGGRYAIRIGSAVTATPLISLATGASSGFTDSSSAGVANITDLALFNAESTTVYSSNITNQSGLRVMNASDLGGSITNQYGVYVDNLTSGTNNYSIYAGTARSYFGGNVGIGTTSPYAKLSVVGQTVADYFTAANTNATSTFYGDLAVGSTGVTGARLTINKTSVSTAAGSEFGISNTISDTGVTTSGTDSIFGLSNVITHGGATGGTSDTYGVYNSMSVDDVVSGASNAYGIYTLVNQGPNATIPDNSFGAYANLVGTNAYGSRLYFNNAAGVGTGYGMRLTPSALTGTGMSAVYGMYVDNFTNATNVTGLYVADQGTSATHYGVYTDGSTKSYFGGNVGIGTTSPYAKLSVVGSVVADSYTALSTTATSTFTAGVNVAMGIGYFIGGSKVLNQDASNNFTAGIQNTVSSANTSVAVGSYNTISSILATAIGFANTANNINATAIGNQNIASSSSATALGFQNIASAAGAVAVGNGVSNSIASSLMIGPSNSSKLTILSSGNVGIGTSSPWAKLAVQDAYGSQAPLFDVASTTSSGFATSSIFSVAASGEVKIKGVNSTFALLGPNLFTIASSSGTSMVSVSPFGKVNINRGDITYASEFGADKQSSLNVKSTRTSGSGLGGYYDTPNTNISSVFTYNPTADDSEYYAGNFSRLIFGGVGDSIFGSVSGSVNNVRKTNTGTAAEVNGVVSYVDIDAGITNSAFGINSLVYNDSIVANSVQNAYGIYSSIDGIAAFNDVITNAYGLYTNFDLTNITNAYAIYTNGSAKSYFGGNVGIGTTSPYAELSVVGDVVADSYIALSTTSTSTFAAGVNVGSGSGYFMNEKLALSGDIGSDTVIGFGNTVNVSGLAIGNSNTASALSSVAVGLSNNASSLAAVAMGYTNIASNLFTSAVGYVNSATSSGATALGYINNAGGSNSVAIGNSNNAYAAGSIAIGRSITNTITDSLQIGPSNTAKLTILSTGNYGIGTTSPNAKLNIYSNVTTNGQIGGLSTDLVSSSLAGGAVYGNKTTLSSIGGVPPDTSVYLNHTASTVSCFGCGLVKLYGNYVSFANDSSNSQRYGFYADSAGSGFSTKSFFANLDDNSGAVGYTASSTASFSGDYLNFTKGNSTILTVEGGGNVGIGTSTPAKALQVIGDIRTGTTGTNGCIENFAGTALAGTCSSDETLKKDITPIGNILSKLAQITPSTFYWNDLAASTLQNSTETINYGLVAQDVAPVFPDMVSVTSSGYLGVNYSMLPILTLQGLLDMNAMVESLSSTTAPLTDASGEKTFAGKFFDRLTGWFADRANGIQDLFANRVRTKTLCISDETEGETCITKDQLDKLLLEVTKETASGNQSVSGSASVPTESVETQVVASSTDTVTATSTVSEELLAEGSVEVVAPDQTEGANEEGVITEPALSEVVQVEAEVLPIVEPAAEDPSLIE